MKPQSGFTLVETMVVLVILSIGTGILTKGIYSKSQRRADVNAVKGMINLASTRSLVEAKHYGVHLNPQLKTAGLFLDKNNDNSFNFNDTLISYIRCNKNSSLGLVNGSNGTALDLCFKKNGSVASGDSYKLTYVAPAGDSAKLYIIAASGRIQGP